MTDREKILDRLGKIKAMAESAKEIGNEAEAQAFAGMLNNLLLKHKLEMTDIQYEAHVKEEPVEQYTMRTVDKQDEKGHWRRVYADYPDVEVKKVRVEWIQTLAKVIARAHNCDILVQKGSSRVYFVGMRTNLEIVEYLFITMHRTVEKLSEKAYGETWRKIVRQGGDVTQMRGYKSAWTTGFITRLIQRFEEEKRKMENDTTGTALIRLNKEALAVKSWIDKNAGKPIPNPQGRDAYNDRGYRDGQRAADQLNLKANAMKEGGPRENQKLIGAQK